MATDISTTYAAHSFAEDILTSVLSKSAQPLRPEEAQFILKWRFSDAEVERMHDLAQKNRDDTLTASERDELHGFLRVGQFLDVLHAKALAMLAKSNRE
jgi:hypothetical protein